MEEVPAKKKRDDAPAEGFEIKEEMCKSIKESFEELKAEMQIANSNQEKAIKLLVENQEQEIQEKIMKMEKRINHPDDTKLEAEKAFKKLLKSCFIDAFSLEDGRKVLRHFDSDNQEFSDVVLEVGGQKFYVLKKFLAMHSLFFEKLFDGESKESQIWEMHSREVDPIYFQKFLEALYGEYKAVNDSTVETLLLLNYFYKVKTVSDRCCDFLKTTSKMTLVKKTVLAVKYSLKDLLECFIGNTTIHEFGEVVVCQKDLAATWQRLRKLTSLS